MSLIEKQLGRVLSAKDLSEILGADEKTIRKYYQRLGGIRIGRHYKFFEKEVINAVQTWNEIHWTDKEEREEEERLLGQRLMIWTFQTLGLGSGPEREKMVLGSMIGYLCHLN